MFELTAIEKPTGKIEVESSNPVQRLTAFWGFSEAGFGGVLHITRLPFKGIFIAGAATFFISMIAQFSKRKGEIIKSSILVIIIKFLVSPHTPVTAAIAVFAQGLFGELFFLSKIKKIIVPAFAIFIQFITAVQKIIIVTVLFGENLWKTIDDFSNSVLNKFVSVERIEFSYLIVISYITIHVIAGIFLSFFILKIMRRFELADSLDYPDSNSNGIESVSDIGSGNKKYWFKKPSGLALLMFFLIVLGFSFFMPDFSDTRLAEVIVMIIRALIIILLWYFLVSPLLRKFIFRLISKQKAKHLIEINNILKFLPQMKQNVVYSWKKSKSFSGIKRIENFIFYLLLFSLSG